MIVAERKPFDEIMEMISPYKKILVLGCGSCVTVCLTGGERQAELLASQISLASGKAGRDVVVDFDCITRQCDREFIDDFPKSLGDYDAILSIACGVGVGFMSGLAGETPILPGLNTTFYGANTAPGVWEEFCHGCGDCALAWTGGICPIARCSKSLINGACGGTNDRKCEIDKDMECGWLLIYERLKETGRLDELRKMRPSRDWSKDRGKGVRRLSHEELATLSEESDE